MALVRCRECGRDVSTEAIACPHCGVPSPAQPASRDHPPVPESVTSGEMSSVDASSSTERAASPFSRPPVPPPPTAQTRQGPPVKHPDAAFRTQRNRFNIVHALLIVLIPLLVAVCWWALSTQTPITQSRTPAPALTAAPSVSAPTPTAQPVNTSILSTEFREKAVRALDAIDRLPASFNPRDAITSVNQNLVVEADKAVAEAKYKANSELERTVVRSLQMAVSSMKLQAIPSILAGRQPPSEDFSACWRRKYTSLRRG